MFSQDRDIKRINKLKIKKSKRCTINIQGLASIGKKIKEMTQHLLQVS